MSNEDIKIQIAPENTKDSIFLQIGDVYIVLTEERINALYDALGLVVSELNQRKHEPRS